MMKKVFSKLVNLLRKSTKGQSLVEMAVITPVAIFLLLGVFEVGWVLRSYIVLVNANREATRFSVRPNYLDFSIKDIEEVGYQKVLTHANASLSEQVDLDFDTNSKLIVSHIVVDTGYPYEPTDDPDDVKAWDCDAIDESSTDLFTYDDLILHPEVPGWEYYVQAFPTSTITATRINYEDKVKELAVQNNRFNCESIKKGGEPSSNNIIITEVFYEHPQLFGFPVISNPLTDPVDLYSHTVMRLAPSARIDDVVDTVGPLCEAYPIIVHEDTIKYFITDPGDPDYMVNKQVDIFDGNDSGDWGWLAWNPGDTSAVYLKTELQTNRTPLNDYTNARDDSDHELTAGDYVASLQGVNAKVESSDKLVSALAGRKIRIPVWDTFHKGTGGKVDAYHIVGFAWVQIEESGIDLDGKTVLATYLGDASEGCDGSSVGDVGGGGGGGGGGGSTPTPTPTPTLTPTPSSPSTYQAEEANVGGGNSVESNHSGYNGTGFVNFSKSGGYVEYQNVDGGSGGSKTLQFRYALGAGSSRTGQLRINGVPQSITFNPTGGWNKWATTSVVVTLNSGTSNTIRLESTGQDLANQDQMTVN